MHEDTRFVLTFANSGYAKAGGSPSLRTQGRAQRRNSARVTPVGCKLEAREGFYVEKSKIDAWTFVHKLFV